MHKLHRVAESNILFAKTSAKERHLSRKRRRLCHCTNEQTNVESSKRIPADRKLKQLRSQLKVSLQYNENCMLHLW